MKPWSSACGLEASHEGMELWQVASRPCVRSELAEWLAVVQLHQQSAARRGREKLPCHGTAAVLVSLPAFAWWCVRGKSDDSARVGWVANGVDMIPAPVARLPLIHQCMATI